MIWLIKDIKDADLNVSFIFFNLLSDDHDGMYKE